MTEKVWPGVPATFFLGFTAFSMSSKENTTEAVPTQKFHEVGYFQTEAGLRSKPAPDPSPDGEYNNWGKLHDSSLVVQLLGHEATMAPDGWKTAIADQTAVGLVNLRRKLESNKDRLGELYPQNLSSTWAGMLAFTIFSRGAGQTMRCLAPYKAQLLNVPEADRWLAWEALIAADITNDTNSIGDTPGHGGAPWAIMRSRQKHDSGLLFAERNGLDTGWFLKPDRARDTLITRKAYE